MCAPVGWRCAASAFAAVLGTSAMRCQLSARLRVVSALKLPGPASQPVSALQRRCGGRLDTRGPNKRVGMPTRAACAERAFSKQCFFDAVLRALCSRLGAARRHPARQNGTKRRISAVASGRVSKSWPQGNSPARGGWSSAQARLLRGRFPATRQAGRIAFAPGAATPNPFLRCSRRCLSIRLGLQPVSSRELVRAQCTRASPLLSCGPGSGHAETMRRR